jgi:hypothetical protein
MARPPIPTDPQPPEYDPGPNEAPDQPTPELPDESFPESQPWPDEGPDPYPPEIPQ